ncbi:TPA: AAA family ATPase [Clostridium botulinum]|nr:AAA family ATPase [Clostridium botulinum]HCL4458543.1 AAA family ATPase [Clostridium botulinum]HCL4462455.1 AAA family ATPase [Clostridium botulinum]HCL4473514.1 AAA family ATPase [Clostridium botulinum]HCL4477104.1 AAA family ATPase [Clostridium botulinum]
MKIDNINIRGIGGIENLYLEFNNGLNLICGANGIGKTTILESISHAFSNNLNSNILKKHANYDTGYVSLEYDKEGTKKTHNFQIKEFEAYKTEVTHGCYEDSLSILTFKTHRTINYAKLDGVRADKECDSFKSGLEVEEGIKSDDIKGWLINRILFSQQSKALDNSQLENLKLALECFSMLSSEVKYSRIIPDTLDIMVNTSQGEIYFEYLSSGYKSCFYILLGIIKQIEFRFKNPHIEVKNFNGIVLIDELDLHLHPEWQAKIIWALKKIIPNAQIIATTHSPNMVQAVLPNEIIALTRDEKGDIQEKKLNLGKYGLQGWTIEEILIDVMGLKSTSSELYLNTIKAFDNAMDNDDTDEIKKNYIILNDMLHPDNPIRKILEIQMAGFEK